DAAPHSEAESFCVSAKWRSTEIPRRHVREEHRPVVRLGVLDDACVLFGVKELVARQLTIAQGVLGGMALQLKQHVDNFVPAGFGQMYQAVCPTFEPRASRSRTSSSVVCEKSSYQRPIAWNGSGVTAQTMSSTAVLSWVQVSGDAIGTATTIRPAPCCR